MPISDDKNCLTEPAILQLKKHIDTVDCEGPTYLLEILDKVRKFTTYSKDCIDRYPEDACTHRRLAKASTNIDCLLSATIAQLARMEGFVDENNEFAKRDRTQKI